MPKICEGIPPQYNPDAQQQPAHDGEDNGYHEVNEEGYEGDGDEDGGQQQDNQQVRHQPGHQ